jgi:hypothetical protein
MADWFNAAAAEIAVLQSMKDSTTGMDLIKDLESSFKGITLDLCLGSAWFESQLGCHLS